jgi:hypothetical protein
MGDDVMRATRLLGSEQGGGGVVRIGPGNATLDGGVERLIRCLVDLGDELDGTQRYLASTSVGVVRVVIPNA